MEREHGNLTEEEKRVIDDEIARIDQELAELGSEAPFRDYSKRSNWKAQPLDDIPELESITASDLMDLDLPPLEYIVEDFLPLGLGLLGAPPKSFKSYMCLDMCLCICQGFDFLGFKTKKSACLYMDLESTRRRPKARIGQILQGKKVPKNLHIVVKAKPIGKGFEEQLRRKLRQFPDIRVVVVDVFKVIRPPKKAGADPYERDYEDYGVMKQLADELNIAILMVTHTTKMKHPDDAFNELSGSVGTLGSVDVAMVIKKESREDDTAKLYITGRDLEDQCYEIQFDKDAFKWKKLGTHKDMEAMRFELEYRSSPVVGTVKKLVEQNCGKWEGTASEVISASKYFTGLTIYDKPEKVGKDLSKFSKFLSRWDFIEFHYDENSRPRKYIFVKNNPFTDITDGTDGTDTTDGTVRQLTRESDSTER